ncbi:hypothetical protein IWW49_001210 [Coemansia sp. RSA 1797]|nr:hypothetical protein IWW49_001210 [Coemansia sp. RSA 1797]
MSGEPNASTSDAMDTASTTAGYDFGRLEEFIMRLDERMSRMEATQQASAAVLLPPAQRAAAAAPPLPAPSVISSAPSGSAASVSVKGSLELFRTNGQRFSGRGIQWSAQRWEAVQRQRITRLPENCDPADIVATLMSLLTGDAQKAMSGATPTTVDEFFDQLGQCFTAPWYYRQVSNVLESGGFFRGVEDHQRATMALRVLDSLPAIDNSAVMVARAISFADETLFAQLNVIADEATMANIRIWCARYQRRVNVRSALRQSRGENRQNANNSASTSAARPKGPAA